MITQSVNRIGRCPERPLAESPAPEPPGNRPQIRLHKKKRDHTCGPVTRESSGVHNNVQKAVHLPGGEPATSHPNGSQNRYSKTSFRFEFAQST